MNILQKRFISPGTISIWKIFLVAIVLLLFCIISDHLIQKQYFFPSQFWGVYDNFVHGLTGVIVAFPLVRSFSFLSMAGIFLIGSLLDVDHFIAANSLSIKEIIQLPMRPLTHSITFALLVSVLVMLLVRNNKWRWGWIFFACLASHITRDASSGVTPLLYPSSIERIPYWFYLVLQLLLVLASSALARSKHDPQ